MLPSRRPMTELPLNGGNMFYAVVDVEALILGNVINIVEQIAFVLYNLDGVEVWAEKHMIEQPLNGDELSRKYGVDREIVQRSLDAYERITKDNHIHPKNSGYEKWATVRNHIKKAFTDHAAKVYAKGPALEISVFYNSVTIDDLALYGCPKYPGKVHDPLNECRYFAQFIPEIQDNRVYQNAYWSFWN